MLGNSLASGKAEPPCTVLPPRNTTRGVSDWTENRAP